jgi:hypothetical protein
VLVLGWTLGSAQDGKPLADAGTTICNEPQQGGGLGKWVTSKQGFSAAVELRVTVSGKDEQRHCTTSWILRARRHGDQPQSITIVERDDVPEDNEWVQENSFEIMAWSRTHRNLAFAGRRPTAANVFGEFVLLLNLDHIIHFF